MTKTYLDAAALSAKADELETLNNQLLAEIGVLNDTEATLAGMWEGPAKESFRNAYASDSVQMKNFYNCVFVYVQVIRANVCRYRCIEMRNEEIARIRCYR